MTRATMANAATRSPLAAARCAGRRLATAALLPPLAPSRPVQPAAGLRLPAAPRRGRPLVQRAAARSDGLDEILAKYGSSGGGGGDSRAPLVKVAPPRGASGGMGNGLFAVLILNFGLFAASNLLHVPALSASVLALNHWKPQWWQVSPLVSLPRLASCIPAQSRLVTCRRAAHLAARPQFVTATFMHANWQHLSSNAFALLVFGRMVEEEEGAFGLWATYLLAGVGGTLASYLSAPHTHTVSLGASGAVFGLFMVRALRGAWRAPSACRTRLRLCACTRGCCSQCLIPLMHRALASRPRGRTHPADASPPLRAWPPTTHPRRSR